jgi:hypothetical protein
MLAIATNHTSKKVCFAQEEVSAVHFVEKIDKEDCERLFYQDKDFIQFRVAFRQFRAKQLQRDAQLLRFNAMTRQVRAEMQASNQPKLVTVPLPTPIMSTPQQRRNITPKGCARIA